MVSKARYETTNRGETINRNFFSKISKLNNIRVNGTKINYFKTSSGELRFELDLVNCKDIKATNQGTNIKYSDMGISKIDLQDAAGANTYHIPQGILID